MSFLADLHIHSRFSRATSKDLTIQSLAADARKKGLSLVGTGDLTHDGWISEIKQELTEKEDGFLGYRDSSVDFVLTGETSHIYKDKGATRKVHCVLISPGFSEVEQLYSRLNHLGVNLKSDGRPIMKVTPHDLLEMMLDISERMILIPAHIWTPWFSLFGSKSGYDRIEDCFGDLTDHIYALETGLSSDVPMNRSVSALDRYTLVSNSDAHSASKLGRNATRFPGELSYDSMHDSLKKGEGMHTLDTYPQTGKYHLDGHRKCDVALHPHEAEKLDNICPVCRKPLTLGVLHRVHDLANRQESDFDNFTYFCPLQDLISATMGVGPQSKKVADIYSKILEIFPTEFDVLLNVPVKEIKEKFQSNGISVEICEAIKKVREGRIDVNPGYDGVFGSIDLHLGNG